MTFQRNPSNSGSPSLRWFLGCSLILLIVLFAKSFASDYVFFSNDGPLGAMQAQQNRVPVILTGLWQDLNWLGMQYPVPPPTISTAIRLVTTSLIYSKFFAPISIL